MAQRLRDHFPNRCHGLEFCYYYTGDDWTKMKDTRCNDAADDLPSFQHFLFGRGPAEQDDPARRIALPRTVAAAQDPPTAAKRASPQSGLQCPCGWSGSLSSVADYETDRYGIEWTCPGCNTVRFLAAKANQPIKA